MWAEGMPEEYKNSIVTGDHKELAKRLPDNSIDICFTDPPYLKEYVHTYIDLLEYCPRILKPGGSVFVICGQWQVDQIIRAADKADMRFYWCSWLSGFFGTKISRYNPNIVCCGKPILWFYKPWKKQYPRPYKGVFWWDEIMSSGKEKSHHEWQQSLNWAERGVMLCPADGVVLEPFTGGGTVPVACKMHGRNFVAFEIDENTAIKARDRVATAQLVMRDLLHQSELTHLDQS